LWPQVDNNVPLAILDRDFGQDEVIRTQTWHSYLLSEWNHVLVLVAGCPALVKSAASVETLGVVWYDPRSAFGFTPTT